MTAAGAEHSGSIPHLPDPPTRVRFPVMRMTWDWLTFLHWPYDPAVVQRLLPRGLTVEPYDDAAWVGLVPFRMHVRGPVGPELPGVANFPETNVRTYVRGPDGRTGIWFFSLDAARVLAVLAARLGLGLPYIWSTMRIDRDGDLLTYRAARRHPRVTPARSLVRVRAAEAFPVTELTPFDHYLTARFRLWSLAYGRLVCVEAEHPRWPLRRGSVLGLDDELITAAGLPAPAGEPVVHVSDGVDVKIGLPALVRTPDGR